MFGEMLLLLLLAAIARQRHFQFGTERDAVRIKQGIFRFQRFELAEKVGTNKTYISRIEKGIIEPGVGLFFRIIDALGLKIEIVKPIM